MLFKIENKFKTEFFLDISQISYKTNFFFFNFLTFFHLNDISKFWIFFIFFFFFFKILIFLIIDTIGERQIYQLNLYTLPNKLFNFLIENVIFRHIRLNILSLASITHFLKIIFSNLLILIILLVIIPISKFYYNSFFITFNYQFFCLIFIVFFIFWFLLFLYKIVLISSTIIVFEIVYLLFFALCSLILALITRNILVLFLVFEVFTYCLYILIALQKQFIFKFKNFFLLYISNRSSLEASIKYFFYGNFNSLFFIFCIIFFLSLNLDFNYIFLSNFFYFLNFKYTISKIYLLAICCFLIFFFFKLSLVPFHWWILDIFQASHFYIIFFIAIPVKIIIVFIFIILLNYTFFLWTTIFEILFIIISILSLYIAAFGILYQTHVKRFLAYSTINNMSYILLGLSTGHYYGIYSAIIYLINYILLMVILCSIFLVLTVKFKNTTIVYLIQLSGLFFSYPIVAFLISLVFFSLIGIPPLSGFWGKFYILQSIFLNIQNNLQPLLWFFVIISIIFTSILSCFAYLRIIKIIFFEKVIKQTKLIFLTIYSKIITFFFLIIIAWGILFFSFIYIYDKQINIFFFFFLKNLFLTYSANIIY